MEADVEVVTVDTATTQASLLRRVLRHLQRRYRTFILRLLSRTLLRRRRTARRLTLMVSGLR